MHRRDSIIQGAVVGMLITAGKVLNAAPFDAAVPPLLALADVIVVNEVELAGYAGETEDADVAARALGLVGREGQAIVVTLGAGGSIMAGGDRVSATPAIAARVVDTTGADDCFCCFLSAGLAAGRSLELSIGHAHRAAAIAVGRHGAAPSIPFLAEVG